MRKIYFYILFFFILSSAFTQNKSVTTIKVKKAVSDTVDFSSFPFFADNYYVLTKLVQFNGQIISDMNGSQLLFFTTNDSSRKFGPSFGLKTKNGDTLISNYWDSNEKEVHNTTPHSSGVIRLNKLSKTIFVTSTKRDKKTNTFVQYSKVFLVLKWTFSGITLKDLTNNQLNRTFYFRRQNRFR
jgi:hypothetical protein